jgi:hypothetical protein
MTIPRYLIRLGCRLLEPHSTRLLSLSLASLSGILTSVAAEKPQCRNGGTATNRGGFNVRFVRQSDLPPVKNLVSPGDRRRIFHKMEADRLSRLLDVEATRDWRWKTAEQFPEDQRNRKAAELLDRLAREIAALNGSPLTCGSRVSSTRRPSVWRSAEHSGRSAFAIFRSRATSSFKISLPTWSADMHRVPIYGSFEK